MKIINILFNHKKSSGGGNALGVERCFIDYAKCLTSEGNEVLSVAKKNLPYLSELKKTGSKFSSLSAFGQMDVISMIKLTFLLLKFNADVIICHSGRALFFARIAKFFCSKKIPIIAIDHGINPKKFLKADYVLTVNSHFSKKIIELGKSEEHALIIPNMIEVPKDFTPIKKSEFKKPLKIGSLGRLGVEKNFDKVLMAMSILQNQNVDCEYVIGGFGSRESFLNELAKKLGLQKKFKILGWVSDKRRFFSDIDIFILPSKYETFGIVLLEAMLYSTPIITSNTWGPDEIIQDQINGLKVSRDDDSLLPNLLANAILKLVEDQAFARKLSEKAYQKFFEEYSADIVGKKLNLILKNIVSSYK